MPGTLQMINCPERTTRTPAARNTASIAQARPPGGQSSVTRWDGFCDFPACGDLTFAVAWRVCGV